MNLLLRIFSKLLIALGVLTMLLAVGLVIFIAMGYFIGEAMEEPMPGGALNFLIAGLPFIFSIACFILSGVVDHFASEQR